jgi:glucoamylase
MPVERYQLQKVISPLRSWRFNQKTRTIPTGKKLRIELLAAARIHWTADEWGTIHDHDTREIGFGIHLVDLPTRNVAPGARIRFTFYWHDAERWEGIDFTVTIDSPRGIATAVAAR